MNQALKKLASDLQEIRRKNRETPVADAPDIPLPVSNSVQFAL